MNDGFSIKCPSLFGLATSMSKEIHQKVATVPASVKVSKRSETEERENKQRSVEKVLWKSSVEKVNLSFLLPPSKFTTSFIRVLHALSFRDVYKYASVHI